MEKHFAAQSRIQFHFLLPAAIRNRRLLKSFIATQFRKERTPIQSLQIIFCSDQYLLDLNQKFLHHDTYTDIITFNLAGSDQPVIGEIYISVDRVRENASSHSVELTEELHRVIFHGILHLMGGKDKTRKEKEQMRLLENALLRKYKRYVSRET